jgi:transposase
MTQRMESSQLREQAIALRRAGKSRREIKELLGITSNWTLNESLKGEPPLPQNIRPNAKDDVRAKARTLREQGLSYNQIAAELGVSKSSVSLWVRDLPRPEPLSYEAFRERHVAGVRRRWAAERQVREARRVAARAAAANEIGDLNDREIIIAGAIAYWVRRSQEQAGSTVRPGGIHEQRPRSEHAVPAVPRCRRNRAGQADLPGPDP